MKVSEINEILNKYAPLKLSNDYVKSFDAYDNSGILVDVGEEISGVLFSLDLTFSAIESAINKGCNLIVTHHPAIYKPISSINENSPVLFAIKNKISVISYHLNLDVAKNGIDHCLASGLGGKNAKIIEVLGDGVGYGRAFILNKTFKEVVETYKKEFSSNRIITYGDLNEKVEIACSFCGSGLSNELINLNENADLFISSDVPHHVILEALSKGKKLMIITHYSSEFYGFDKFYQQVKSEFDIKTTLFRQDEYL